MSRFSGTGSFCLSSLIIIIIVTIIIECFECTLHSDASCDVEQCLQKNVSGAPRENTNEKHS